MFMYIVIKNYYTSFKEKPMREIDLSISIFFFEKLLHKFQRKNYFIASDDLFVTKIIVHAVEK